MDEDGRLVHSDEARRGFRSLLNSVEHDGEHVTVLRYNTPAAVIVPVDWYEQALAEIGKDKL
jgi:prevent-host-death family protein